MPGPNSKYNLPIDKYQQLPRCFFCGCPITRITRDKKHINICQKVPTKLFCTVEHKDAWRSGIKFKKYDKLVVLVERV